MTALLLFGLSLVYIFFKALQQLNVVQGRYWGVMPCSLAMGLCEVAIVLAVVRADTLWLGVASGLGAGLGAMLAMYINRRMDK